MRSNMNTGVDLRDDPFLTHSSAGLGSQMDPGRSKALQDRKHRGKSWLQTKWNRRSLASKFGAGREHPMWVLLTGAVFPTLMFLAIVALFTFDFIVPSFVWAIVLLLFVALLCEAATHSIHMGSLAGSTPNLKTWQWIPAYSLIFACTTGYILGSTNYNIFMLPYLHYTFNREYTNVNPGENADGFQDAGAVYFSAAARVNLAQSVGFKDYTSRFCVAPVVGDDPSDTVSFFAAGIDCCGSRHDFNCWDAADPAAHAGVRVSESDPLGGHMPQFKKAAAMAASVYGFKSSENPVLVLWVKDPPHFAHQSFWIAMVFLMGCAALGLIGMCCCITGFHHLRVI